MTTMPATNISAAIIPQIVPIPAGDSTHRSSSFAEGCWVVGALDAIVVGPEGPGVVGPDGPEDMVDSVIYCYE